MALRVICAALLAVALLLYDSSARAQSRLTVHRIPDGRVRIDGMLRDWRGVRFARAGRGRDASMRYALGYDDEGLYVGAEVADQRLVRTERRGPKEDAVVVTLVLPARRGRTRGVELWFFAGEPGESRGSVGIARIGGRPKALRGAKVVEGPRDRGRGYVLEARVPWRLIPGSERWQGGRGAIRLRDVDKAAHPRVESEPASAPVDPDALGELPELMPTSGPSALLRKFKKAKNLVGTGVSHDMTGDVAGDGRAERVVILDRFLVVLGPGYRDGKAYDFVALPVASGADVRGARLRDLTGDGEAELTVLLRQRNQHGSRDVWRVFHFDGRNVQPGFGVEVRKATGQGAVAARLKVRRARRGPPIVEVRAGRARGLDAESYREAKARDAESILLPWGPVRRRRYQWNGERFEVVAEQPNPEYRRRAERRARRQRERARERRKAERSRRRQRRERPSVGQLIAKVRKELELPSSARPRFKRRVNVIGDRRPETLLVLGKALVGVGPGFRGGRGFFYYEVADSARALRRIRMLDLTGDGPAEVAIRVRQKLGELPSGGPPVYRDVLLVHCFHGGKFPRMLAVEVARMQGRAKFVRNEVKVVDGGKRHALLLRPGRARGWARDQWPFADGADDGVASLLLPWRDGPVRYVFHRGKMRRR